MQAPNLQPTARATFLEAAYLRIDKPGAKHLLGRCVAKYATLNGGGRMFACNNVVYAGDGFADLNGAPFQAYFCAACAAKLIA